MSDIESKIAKLVERFRATTRLEDILPDVGKAICRLFNADRLTLYVVSEEGGSIVSRLKMGLDSFKDIRLPISASSLAGYAALKKKTLNIADAYDQAEIKRHSADLVFLKAVDQRTGYRSRQMLVAPMLEGAAGSELLGVLQLINNLEGRPFSSVEEAAFVRVARFLAQLVLADLEIATRDARKKREVQPKPLQQQQQVQQQKQQQARQVAKPLAKAPAPGESIGDLLSSLDDEQDAIGSSADEVSAAADNELVKLVNKIIVDAYNQGASDIHVEPTPGKGKTGIRFRKAGSLSPYIEIPAFYRNPLLTRLKLMCDLDISEKRRPQDGKIKFKKFGPLDIELRVATIPTTDGMEDIVMKIMPANSGRADSGDPAIPVPITDEVYFTVTAPSTVSRSKPFVLDVWAHLQGDRAAVLEQAADEAGGRPFRSKTRGASKVARGKRLAVHASVDDFGFSETDSILWTGTTGNATFAVAVPDQAAAGSHIGTVTFAVDGIQISRLHFELEVGPAEGVAGERKVRERRPSSAFASYASEDRDRVLGRIQGMQKLLPDLNIFLDIASIRSGEDWARRLEEEIARRETFYLFWSLAASRSEWVEKEWRAALRLKGIENIDPVPLEPPQKAPPPVELASLHFNEWTLAFQRE